MNVTLVPAQIVVIPETAAGFDTIDTEGVTVVLMVKFVPLSVPVTAGVLLVTRILYPVPVVAPPGTVPLMV